MIVGRQAVALFALLAAACTSQARSSPAATTATVPDPPDALVALPSVDPDMSPSLEAWNETLVDVGGWDWGAPCRVPVHELVGGAGPQISRTFTVNVAAEPGSSGFVMSFDEVEEQLRGMTNQEVAIELGRYFAVLPTIRLDGQGRFVEFTDLDESFDVLAERAGTGAQEIDAAVVETVLDRTILGWFGFWVDHDTLPANPDRLPGERIRHFGALEYRTANERFVATEVGDGAWGPQTDDKVWFSYTERIDSPPTTPTDDLLTERVDVSAIMAPASLRPSYVSITIGGSNRSDNVVGDSVINAYLDRRIVNFDWESAEGCE